MGDEINEPRGLGWVDGGVDRWMNGWVDMWVDGWIVGGWVDG